MASKKILLVDDSCTARLVNRMVFSQKTNYVLLSAVDLDDLGHPEPHAHQTEASPPQYSPDGQWWWDGHRWISASER